MNDAEQPNIPSRLEALWDEQRDGTLSAAEQQEFDALLAKNEDARALWQAESQWLNTLSASRSEIGAAALAESAFTSRVIEQWQTDHAGVSSTIEPTPESNSESVAVIGRIEPISPWRRVASIAAAIILVAGGVFLANQMNPSGTPGGTFVNKGDTGTVTPDAMPISPVSMLVANTNAAGLEEAHPTQIRRRLSEAVAILNPSNLVDLLEPSMPDPADFFEPLGRGNKS